MKVRPMPGGVSHLTDEEILRFADGELSPRKRSHIETHLNSCIACRSRLQQVGQILDEAGVIRLSENASSSLPSPDARVMLKARIRESASAERLGLHPFTQWLTFRGVQWGAICGAAFLTIVVIWTMRREARLHRAADQMATLWLAPVPDRTLTPGVTVAVTKADICHSNAPQETRPIPASTQAKVFQEYRTPQSYAAEYEVDYLITPGLGGADDIHNLWLEPYSSTIWNAHVKDELEDRLHEMVCSGDLDLATAQRDISTDWISAYKKYFHTQNPILSHSGAVSDHL